jgi:hypothetical protein
MKLQDLDNNPRTIASKALKENYEVPFNVAKMPMASTRSMLNKVRGLIKESKQSGNFYQQQTAPSYMKLVFMEQALVQHFNDLRSRPQPRIVVENEEVEKSQVVLAAQDLVDSVQKMLEEVSDMLVKELPALTTGIQSEIGVNESEQFNSQAGESLAALQAAITEAKSGLQSALNGITGQGDAGAFDAGFDDGAEDGVDAGFDAGEEVADADMDAEMPEEEPEMNFPDQEPEEEPTGGVGRAKR